MSQNQPFASGRFHQTRRCWLAVIFLLAASADHLAGQEAFADAYEDSIHTLLDARFSDGKGAMVIGLVDERGSRIYAAGKLSNGQPGQVDGDTVFELGSVTKVFTALLLLDAVRRGEVRLDEPVERCLPSRVSVPSYGGQKITLRHLASQDSGLPWHPHYFADRERRLTLPELRDAANAYTVDDMYRFLSGFALTRRPGAEFQYSNVGLALLGHALERRANSDYESLVIDRICRTLSMDDTRITLSPAQAKRLARGHWADGSPAENVHFQAMRPAGSLLSTGNDLLKFLSAGLGLDDSGITPLVQQSLVIRHVNHPRFGKTAMPWFDERVYNPPGTEILGHGGGGYGYLAFIGVEKKKRRGVVVLTSQLGFSPYGVGWTLLQELPLTEENITYTVREIVALGFALDVDVPTGLPRLKTVWPKSPAGHAGLSPGLTIRKINGTNTDGRDLQECLRMMGGPIGTKVQLELFDSKRNATRTVQLTREKFLAVTTD